MIAAESRPSPTVILSEAPNGRWWRKSGWGRVGGAQSKDLHLLVQAGVPDGKGERSFDCAPPCTPRTSAAIFPTPPPQATRRSAQDDRLLEERSAPSPKCMALVIRRRVLPFPAGFLG